MKKKEIPGTAAGVVESAKNYAENVVFGAIRGHGFAAEKANHLFDVLRGKDAKIVGGNNAKNGADRIVDGTQIQTKYCDSGSKCINECFDKDGFRYWNSNGKPMQIEVPSDKYDSAVQALEDKIRKGQVKGISDPEQAKEIVKKGAFTYEQAKNIAQFGTIESLTYDVANGIKLAGTTMGISAVISYGVAIWNGEDWDDALESACYTGLKVGGIAWVSSILTAQLGRTGIEQSLRGTTDWVVKQMGAKTAAWLANGLRSGSNIYGAAAMNNVSKLLRGNIVTGVVTTLVLSSADFARLFSGKVSGAQVFKNVTTTATAVAGGTGGWFAGAAGGAAVGSAIPLIGTAAGGIIGGILGSLAGGSAASATTSAVLDKFIEDDAKEMLKIVENVFANLATDYLLNKDEAEKILERFLQDKDIPDTLRNMYASENRNEYAIKLLRPLIEKEVKNREKVKKLPSNEEVIKQTGRIIDGLVVEDSQSEDKQQVEIEKNIESLEDIIWEYQHELNDDSSVYCGMGLISIIFSKKERAINSYAHPEWEEDDDIKIGPNGDLVVLVDITLFGGAGDGFYITEDELYAKPFLEDKFHIKLKDIRDIWLDEKKRAIYINGKSLSYGDSSLNRPMQIIVNCIKTYLEQFS